MITREIVKKLFHYNPETGVFTRLVNSGYSKKGEIAGKPYTMKGYTYLRVTIYGKTYKMHRLAFLYEHGYMPKMIDHIDGDGTNNKISNLRDVSHSENQRNRKLNSSNRYGIPGVYFSRGKWAVYISDGKGKQITIKCKNDFFEACCVRKSAELKFGYHENHGRR